MSDSPTPYRIGVVSDTHGYVHPRLFELLKGVDLILHAGDVGRDDVLMELGLIAPVRAVSGNVDGPPMGVDRPLTRTLDTPAGRIAMTHGHLNDAPAHDLARLTAHFRDFRPDIVIHGHTHLRRLTEAGGVIIFNPGAAGRSAGPEGPSAGLITAGDSGAPARLEHIALNESPV